MDSLVQLVFRGETLDGFGVDDVKRSLGQLLKFDEARQAKLFSGKKVVLKRSVAVADARRYVARLAAMGARVHVEPDTPRVSPKVLAPEPATAPVPEVPSPSRPLALLALLQPTPTAEGADSSTLDNGPPALAPVPSIGAVVEEEIVCPSCGDRQSKRVLCRSCATDMPMGIANKLAADQEARAARLAERRAALGLAPAGDGVRTVAEAPSIWGVGFSGRMARLPYATAGFALMTVMVLTALFALQKPSGASMVVLALVMAGVLFISIRLSVLRCHDGNRSGWWTLLLLVPYVGPLAGLLLSFMPGTSGDNDHGEPPRQGNALFAVLAVAAFGLSMAMSWSFVMSVFEHGWAGAPASPATALSAPTGSLPSAEARAAFKNEYTPAPMNKAFVVSQSGSWGWKSGEASPMEALDGALAVCEAHRKPYTPPCYPVNVNGEWARGESE